MALAALRLLGGTLNGDAGQLDVASIPCVSAKLFSEMAGITSVIGFLVPRSGTCTVIAQVDPFHCHYAHLPDPRKNLAKTLAPGLLLARPSQPRSLRYFSTVWCVIVTTCDYPMIHTG